MTSVRRLTSMVAVIAMLLTLTAVPAFAVAVGSATVTTGDLLSGEDGLVTVRIRNDAGSGVLGLGGGSAIDAFTIEVPQHLVDVAPADVTLPQGWEGGYDDEIGFVFARAANGTSLRPGQSLDVGIGVTADAVADDTTGRFVTTVSDRGGTSSSPAGAPEVTSRILGVLDATVRKPASATNTVATQVTEGQDTAAFRVTVKNFGTQARTPQVGVAATQDSGSSVTTTAASDRLNPGVAKTFTVPATFGAVGTLRAVATATTSASSASSALAPVEVQEAFDAVLEDTLTPEVAVQGGTYDFAYSIDKVAGAQPVTGDATLELDGFTTTAPQSFAAADGVQDVTFDQVTVPSLDNGDYETSSTITGVDGNGADVALTVLPGTLTLDDLLPVVTITVDVGEPDVEGADPATTSGREIEFAGEIGVSSGGVCDDCTVTSAVLRALPSGDEFDIDLTNTDGELAGAQSFTFPAGTTGAVAEVTAARPSGLDATGTSDTVEVDLVAPTLDDPAATARTEGADTIVVTLSELVDASTSRASDWSVDNNMVRSVTANPTPGAATEIVLTLNSRLGDNATPVVSYSPSGLFGGTVTDRVGLEVADQVIDTIDGIVPAAPFILKVEDQMLQDGEFFTNVATPRVGLEDLVVGNTIEIFFDTDDDGQPDGDELVLRDSIGATEQTFTLADLGNVNASHQLIARMVDNAAVPNAGELASQVLNLDFTAARIVDIVVDGQQVTVQFDEVVRGRNNTFDWTVQATQDGRTANRTITSIVDGQDMSSRVLTINPQSYDSGADDAQVLGVRYKFRGSGTDPDLRYEDRATNAVPDLAYTE